MRWALVAGGERGDQADSDVTVEDANGNAVGELCASGCARPNSHSDKAILDRRPLLPTM
jgi:hypothetical protein